jgi:nucleoside phosphorylase
MPNKPYPYNFGVICATKEELDSVVAIFNGKFTRGRGRHHLDIVFSVPRDSTQKLSIYVTTCVNMGNMDAAIRTAEVIISHQPFALFFIGTAASMDPEKVKIGDVVIPQKAVMRIYEKISEEGQTDYKRKSAKEGFEEYFFRNNALIAETRIVNCSPDALSAFAGIPIKNLSLQEVPPLQEVPQSGSEPKDRRKPTIHQDVHIFNCGMVVDSVSYCNFIRSLVDDNMRKVGAIDMESVGFYSAVEAARKTGVGNFTVGLMIRGISDYATGKEQLEKLRVDYKSICVRNAAVVAAELISGLAPVCFS